MKTIAISLPEDLIAHLECETKRRGLETLDELIRQLLESSTEPPVRGANGGDVEGRVGPFNEPPTMTTKEALDRIREISKHCTLGPDLTIRQLIEEGRRY